MISEPILAALCRGDPGSGALATGSPPAMPIRLLRDGDLLELGMAAHEVRARLNDPQSPPTTSIATSTTPTSASTSAGSAPSTAQPGDPEGYLLPFEEIGRKIEETLALNGTGVLLQGGVHPGSAHRATTKSCSGTSAATIRRFTCTPSRRPRSSSSPRRSA